ncbi:glutathione S-transferase family protein [Tardiphaga sp. 215_C5_N2_1]|uniref:glutathione S-transferase family protein n=1 Tax=Tardiphaga sp. 215_C5_N2_1 TaxID=3240774 RepID=UPI003F89CCFA
MIVVYQFATSPFCEKVRRILNFKAVPYELHEVPRAKVAEYARVSPTGKFPAIEHDGHAVWDSTDIARYIERKFPQKPLIPADPALAAAVHILEDWADESLYFYEMTMRLAWEHNAKRVAREFAATMPGVSVEEVLARIVKAVTAITTAQGLNRKPVEQIVADADRHFDALDGLLSKGDWLVGSAVSLADIAVLVQVKALLYAEEVVRTVDRLPRVKDWISRAEVVAPDVR